MLLSLLNQITFKNFKNVKKKKECPLGKKTSKGEEQCRKIFEKLFQGHLFPSIRPDWLKNKETGHNLELDGYNEHLKIAFEYQGIQHYIKNEFFGQTNESLIKQIERDIFKVKRCRELGIDLIVISFFIKFEDIENFIILKINSLL